MTHTGDREIVVVSGRVGMYESVGPPRLEMRLIDNLLPMQPRFQINIQPNRWYISRIFQIWSTPVEVVEELAGDFEPIRSGEIVRMNNNVF